MTVIPKNSFHDCAPNLPAKFTRIELLLESMNAFSLEHMPFLVTVVDVVTGCGVGTGNGAGAGGNIS